MVGASRFERPTSRTPSECANLAALRPDEYPKMMNKLKKAREKFKNIFQLLFYFPHYSILFCLNN